MAKQPLHHDQPYIHPVQIYYEDTDHSGVVYHANYLKYFERAREHMLGLERLVSLHRQQGIGFVVYKAELTYRRGAEFGDSLEIRSRVHLESAYRLIFQQDVHRSDEARPLVEGIIHLACVDQQKQLIPIPQVVIDELYQ